MLTPYPPPYLSHLFFNLLWCALPHLPPRIAGEIHKPNVPTPLPCIIDTPHAPCSIHCLHDLHSAPLLVLMIVVPPQKDRGHAVPGQCQGPGNPNPSKCLMHPPNRPATPNPLHGNHKGLPASYGLPEHYIHPKSSPRESKNIHHRGHRSKPPGPFPTLHTLSPYGHPQN